jgi:hypothetical protein
MTTDPPAHHLDNVRHLHPATPPAVDVDTIAGQLVTLIDLGRAITARNAVAVIPDNEVGIAGQRIEHIAGVVFATLFDIPPPAARR